MKKNHDYRLPLMKESIRLENVPAKINRIHEIKCEGGHIVTADLRIDGLRSVLGVTYDVERDTVFNSATRELYRRDYSAMLDAIRAAFYQYVQSCRIV